MLPLWCAVFVEKRSFNCRCGVYACSSTVLQIPDWKSCRTSDSFLSVVDRSGCIMTVSNGYLMSMKCVCMLIWGSVDYHLTTTAVVTVVSTGFLRSGKVREFWGSQGKSGKTERVRKKSGNFKILLTRPIIYALFSQFLSASGGLGAPGLRPCKHCRLVYITIFYNGTKFSITFVYLVLSYWCRE